ncbi:MAG: ABC transporter substrate-binding protein [Candidatus Coproplasma sp.]
MKKIIKGAICAGLCVAMLGSVGCGGGSSLDSETRQLQLATGALDGNFNPFFYTSANDGNILSLTQIGMITIDSNGDVAYGEDEACVVKDYTVTMYDTREVGTGNVISGGSVNGRTEYEFLIKKGIKFSDGVELTIKDVLFNLYVYLDPAYTGSSTIYSTDIQGLNAYRAQDASLSDDADVDLDSNFSALALARIYDLIDWSSDLKQTEANLTAAQKEDLETVKALFLEEITSDWTSVEQSWEESYKYTYRFTSAWEAYLFNEGLVTVQTTLNSNGATVSRFEDVDGDGVRNEDPNKTPELYYTTLDEDADGKEPQAQHHIDGIAEATTADKVAAYMSANNCDEEYAKLQLEKEYCIQVVYDAYTDKSEIASVLSYWATASNALEEFTGQERTKYYQNITEENKVKTVKGITTKQVTSFNGKDLGEAYDVLKIVINGVDPKAIFNFGFTVAPMHYYSGTYEGVDYVAQANGVDKFGVDVGNKDFFDKVLKNADKNGLPVGAGCYKASTETGSDESDRKTFFKNNVVYFKRNEYFETVGTGIDNAKIKYVNYKVLADDKIMEALEAQQIDFGMPNATNTNVNKVTSLSSYLAQETYSTGGYGYVGINPKFVPEIYVRQAIMKAMDTNATVKNYYTTALATTIYRPMSITSWAYPKDENGKPVGEYESVKYATDTDEIVALVEKAGYTLVDGVYVKTKIVRGISNASLGTKLKLTFTIAGESTDHPAYQMFRDARETLNSIGFDITVQTDIQALKKMNTGNLAVWAAAWSSAVDPDPYQIYHKDSKATSVNNWNYPNILRDSTTWAYEKNIIDKLSDKIDEGRETLNQNERIAIYAECMDLIMDLAVELPTYNRSDLCVYNKNVIDSATLVKNPNHNIGLFDKLWQIDYVK